MSKKILVAVTGGIAAYKAVDVISALKKCGHHVEVMMTDKAEQFVTFSALSIAADKAHTDVPWEPVHINATDDIDAFVIVPATANIIGKIAHGIADDLVTSTAIALALDTKKIVCPAMNTRMWDNRVVQNNLIWMTLYGFDIVSPVEGLLACGTMGMGKLPPTRQLVEAIKGYLGEEE